MPDEESCRAWAGRVGVERENSTIHRPGQFPAHPPLYPKSVCSSVVVPVAEAVAAVAGGPATCCTYLPSRCATSGTRAETELDDYLHLVHNFIYLSNPYRLTTLSPPLDARSSDASP